MSRIVVLQIPLFLFLVMIFHSVEFTFAVLFHPDEIQFRAFLLAPVPMGGYSIAMIAALAEYWLRSLLLGDRLQLPATAAGVVLWVGFATSLLGWAMRAAALFTAQSNFTHLVQHTKRDSHALVTDGVYRICRHPGYLGWFMWSVATQVVLCNPICLILYAIVAWKFFKSRIPEEERYLCQFFGEEYWQYAQKVPCGLPCISQLA